MSKCDYNCTLCKNYIPVSEEPKQKACEHGVKYLTSYTSDELLTACKQCHQQEKPAPSLNTWEKLYRDTWEGANVWSSKAIDEQIEFIASQITLAVQKERERATNQINDEIKATPSHTEQEDEYYWEGIRGFNTGLKKALAIVNKGVEEK